MRLLFAVLLISQMLVAQQQNEDFSEGMEVLPEGDFAADTDDFVAGAEDGGDFAFDFDSAFAESTTPTWLTGGLSAEIWGAGNVRRSSGVNQENLSSLRDFEQRALLQGDFLLNPDYSWFTVGGIITAEADNFRSGNVTDGAAPSTTSPEFALFSLGFSQLYTEVSVESLRLIAGKYPFTMGNSVLNSPANYIRSLGSFWDNTGIWQSRLSLLLPVVTVDLLWLPAWQFDNKEKSRNELETLFAWLESEQSENVFALQLGFFFDPLSLNLVSYLAENDTQDPYINAGLTAALPLGSFFRVYLEGLLGNGFDSFGVLEDVDASSLPPPALATAPKYQWRDFDRYQFSIRGLAGIIFSPTGDTDITFEYYYNGLGLSDAQQQRWETAARDYQDHRNDSPFQGAFAGETFNRRVPFKGFEFSQHYFSLMLAQRNIGLRSELDVTGLISLTIPKLSVFARASVNYSFDDNFAVELRSDGYFGDLDSAFGISPIIANIGVGLLWNYRGQN